jgi:hypothetical protein
MTIDSEFREPTDTERALTNRLLEGDFQGKAELASLLRNALVKTSDDDGGLEFECRAEGTARVSQTIPVEAEGKDEDGANLHMLLHVREGRPHYLEFFREDGQKVKRIPHPSTFELIVLPAAPKNSWPNYGRR